MRYSEREASADLDRHPQKSSPSEGRDTASSLAKELLGFQPGRLLQQQIALTFPIKAYSRIHGTIEANT